MGRSQGHSYRRWCVCILAEIVLRFHGFMESLWGMEKARCWVLPVDLCAGGEKHREGRGPCPCELWRSTVPKCTAPACGPAAGSQRHEPGTCIPCPASGCPFQQLPRKCYFSVQGKQKIIHVIAHMLSLTQAYWIVRLRPWPRPSSWQRQSSRKFFQNSSGKEQEGLWAVETGLSPHPDPRLPCLQCWGGSGGFGVSLLDLS